jgi:ACR3 family arsenite efflux pump ArsB
VPRAIAVTPLNLFLQLLLQPVVVPVFAAFLLQVVPIAAMLSAALRLTAAQGRTLAFSLGTRNSFVVLPFALSLSAGWEAAAVVIVLQSLVELFGMLAYLAWVPRLFAGQRGAPRQT